MKITTVAGTRPEIIKLAPLIPLLDREEYVCHTFAYLEQHYSRNMKDIFFEELGVRNPDYTLEVKSSDTDKLTKAIQLKFEETKPDCVLVYGDTNTTVAGAVAAKSAGSKLFHIEAGLRSFDNTMPEERNRKIVDYLSDFYFAPTELSKSFLIDEGYPQENIFVTGNLVVDACKKYLPKALDRKSFEKPFLLTTLHRQENVDNPERLGKFVKELSEVKERIIFPVHPRTRNKLSEYSIELPEHVKAIEPMGYFDFLNAEFNCELVMTDSGGVQEEAITLGKPCITLRDSTERQETVKLGANILYNIDSGSSLNPFINEMKGKAGKIREISKFNNPYGEKGVAERMLDKIKCIASE